jgi:hypothetical protein
MTRRRAGIAVGLLGLAFLVFYLAVRLLFMDSLGAALAEAEVHSVGDILANWSVPLLVFLLWTYSFRVGMLLAVVGGALYAGMSKRGLWLLAGGGGLYLATAVVVGIGQDGKRSADGRLLLPRHGDLEPVRHLRRRHLRPAAAGDGGSRPSADGADAYLPRDGGTRPRVVVRIPCRSAGATDRAGGPTEGRLRARR